MATVEERSTKDHVDKIIEKYFINDFREGFVNVGEDSTCMTIYYNNYADAIKNFKIYDDDIFVISFPKSGTTWTQEMVWLIANNLDFEKAKNQLEERFPYFDICTTFNCKKHSENLGVTFPACISDSINFAANMSRPRFIKTHLPWSLLPKELQDGVKSPKIIYVMRNPKDVCVSFYYHCRLLRGWKPSFSDFFDVFLAERILYGPYWKHVLGYCKRRNLPNILIITYEELKENLPSMIKKVAKFLEKELTDEQVEKLSKHLNFESMKNNKAVNYSIHTEHNSSSEGHFMRSGTVGSYRNDMTPEEIERMNEWSKIRFENTGFAEEYKHYMI